MKYVKAHQPPHDLSLRFTLYSQTPMSDGKTHTITKYCPFSVRNFPDISQEQLVSKLMPLMKEVALELQHITGFGVDKAEIRKGSTTIEKVLYPTIQPRSDQSLWYSFAISLKFYVYAYQWIKQGRTAKAINENIMNDGWTRQITPTGKSLFKLPVCQKTGIFKVGQYGITYDKHDPVFSRFLARFQTDGHLAFGTSGYFGNLWGISYDYWPPAKNPTKFFKKGPRKSLLASQPTDSTDYVYLIKVNRQNIFKIGKSNDPRSRLDSFQTASPHKLKIVHTFPADNASAAEETLHELFHPIRMEGEWFNLSPSQSDQLLKIERYKDRRFWIDGQGYAPQELLTS